MSLARALTRRHKVEQPSEETPQISLGRATTLKRLDKPIDRSQISLPIELISSTNVMAYEAPDIRPANPHSPLSASSSASFKFSDDSDAPRSSTSSMTSPDISREPSPTVAEPNKQASYFQQPIMKLATKPFPGSNAPAKLQTSSSQENLRPSLPQRAMSHTKTTHQALARKRSTRLSDKSNEPVAHPAPLSPMKVSKSKPSTELPQKHPQPEHREHPFGAELAQVQEVAREFGVKDVRILDEEEQWIIDQGFGRYTADEYIKEIEPLFATRFDSDTPHTPTWL